MVFLRDEAARGRVEEACRAEGLVVADWRRVPTNPRALGDTARASAPLIEQLVVERPFGADGDDAERRAFWARKRLAGDQGVYVCSLSFRTVTYKALCAAGQLAAFYPDLGNEALAVPFAIFHQRFSTNTEPSWERAQPFRMLCHNGEINTIDGQRQLDALPRRVSGGVRQRWRRADRTRRCSTTRSSCSSAAAGTCARRRRCCFRRPGRPIASGTPTFARSTATTPPSWSPGTDRRRSSSRTAASSALPSTATACVRCATPCPPRDWLPAPPRRGRSRCRRARGCSAAAWGPARCWPSILGASGSKRAKRSSGGWRVGGPIAAGWRRSSPSRPECPFPRPSSRSSAARSRPATRGRTSR